MCGACLDRNGLRPCRFYLTKDHRFICASEAGVIPRIPPTDIIKRGRLSPGEILEIDFQKGTVTYNDDLKREAASAQPFGKWIRENGFTIADLHLHSMRPSRKMGWSPASIGVGTRSQSQMADAEAPRAGDPSDQGLRAFGFTHESLELLLNPMASTGGEAMGSMGNDIPLACLSDLPRPVFDFFYQRFAQVSNPPIDPIRESSVMSLSCWIGPEHNLLAPLSADHCKRLWLEQPCLLPGEMESFYGVNGFRGWSMHVVDTTFPKEEGTNGMHRHLLRVCHEACDAIRFGKVRVVVLSDRGVNRDRVAIPSLLCSGAVHQTLVREKLRLHAALVVDSGEPFEVAHHCLLITFGADACCPYNAYEGILKSVKDGRLALPEDGTPT
jgi:glutamate synthase (NADPH/NADH)